MFISPCVCVYKCECFVLEKTPGSCPPLFQRCHRFGNSSRISFFTVLTRIKELQWHMFGKLKQTSLTTDMAGKDYTDIMRLRSAVSYWCVARNRSVTDDSVIFQTFDIHSENQKRRQRFNILLVLSEKIVRIIC